MIKYEDVKHITTEEYFNNNQFSIDAFNDKYRLKDDETAIGAIKRVCDFVASVEKTEVLRDYWSKRWFDEIYDGWWFPAGGIMQGAGSGKNISLANCCHISLGNIDPDNEWDSLEAIIRNCTYDVAKSAAYRQGLGVDFSRIRPRGTNVENSANESTGAVHWMKFMDQISYFIGQNGRIPAMLFSLRCDHPDIEEFIKVKGDRTVIQNANISVHCTDKFYKAVEKDEDWTLHFDIPEIKKGQKVYIDVHSRDMDTKQDEKGWYYIAKKYRKAEKIRKTVKARALMELLAKNMMANAEPGIQNIDIARKYSNSDYLYDPKGEYDPRISGTNACSEQYLSRNSLCVLSSSNCEKFSTDPKEYEWEFEKICTSMNRFLDNVNECELEYLTYATPHQRLAIESLRRTGAGLTNFAGWLFKKNLEYGTKEANAATEHFVERFNYHLYQSSIELGKEKGSFKLFNRQKYEQSPFIQHMMKLGLKFEAMRNCNCSSIAPTGTLSLMFRELVMSYGIEQAFGMYYWKRTRITGKYEYYFCVPSIVRKLFRDKGIELPIQSDTIKDTWDGKLGKPVADMIDANAKKLGIHFKNATEVKPMDKLNMMAGIMKNIDSSISVTYMLPEDSKWTDIYDFIIEAHKKEVKSIAAFPDKKMYGIVTFIPFKDLAVKLLKENIQIHPQNFTEDELKELNITSSTESIVKTKAPKRPKELLCDIYHVKVTKKLDKLRIFDYMVMVGLFSNSAYEIFAIENGKYDKKLTKGRIIKETRGRYHLIFEDGTEIKDITKNTTENEDALTRMTSTALRHGADVSFIVQQLDKVEGRELGSFSTALSRALKHYIKEGTVITGEDCPDCVKLGMKGTLIRENGCVRCIACPYTRCG
jgi:ribonucleoside-diphosphate reductase alpha chain